MNMEIRKHIGTICMLFGVMLTIYKKDLPSDSFYILEDWLLTYWPLFISFIGIYIISLPKKRRR
jgi:hypothetical protein